MLIRALETVEGLDLMRARRGLQREEDLCSGPGKLTQALGIDLRENGSSLLDGPVVIALRPAGRRRPRIVAGERIGITKAVEFPWRHSAAGNRFVSSPRPRPAES